MSKSPRRDRDGLLILALLGFGFTALAIYWVVIH